MFERSSVRVNPRTPVRVEIGRLTVEDGRVGFQDRSLAQPFSAAFTPIMRANSDCDFFSRIRIRLTSTDLNSVTRPGRSVPRRMRPAWRTLSTSSRN
jgi:hypothetical protein